MKIAAMQLLVRSGQWLTGEAGGDACVEVGALRDVLVGTAQSVRDGTPRGLRPGNLLIKFRELASGKPSPVAGYALVRGESLLLIEGEAGVT